MNIQPKVTIIIPVYNVEQYLRQCLDSVVEQTLHELQILCVDHSSTDGSLAILEEFAAKDSRIEILHCENTGGGPGQARNAALPHVKGKYLYFADSDDWLDLTLCEKAYYRLEQSGSDVMFLGRHDIFESGPARWLQTNAAINCYPIQSDALDYFSCSGQPWNRVLRSSFLENMYFRFPEGKFAGEDVILHWLCCGQDSRVIFLPQKLYYYRLHANSIMGQRGEYLVKNATGYTMATQYLQNRGMYEKCRKQILKHQLTGLSRTAKNVLPEYKDQVKQNILDTLDDDTIAFIKEGEGISGATRDFYLDLLDSRIPCPTFVQKLKKINRKVFRPLKNCWRKINRAVLRPLESLVRRIRGKLVQTMTVDSATPIPMYQESNADKRIRELSELVCQLSKEIVELRESQNQADNDSVVRQVPERQAA